MLILVLMLRLGPCLGSCSLHILTLTRTLSLALILVLVLALMLALALVLVPTLILIHLLLTLMHVACCLPCATRRSLLAARRSYRFCGHLYRRRRHRCW